MLLRRGFAIFERDPLDVELKRRLKTSLKTTADGKDWLEQVRRGFGNTMKPFINEGPLWCTYTKTRVISGQISAAALGLTDAQQRLLPEREPSPPMSPRLSRSLGRCSSGRNASGQPCRGLYRWTRKGLSES